MQYEIEGRFRNSVLYGSNLPIEVKMLEAKDEETCSVSVSFESDSTFVLNNFVRNGRLFEGVSLSGQLSIQCSLLLLTKSYPIKTDLTGVFLRQNPSVKMMSGSSDVICCEFEISYINSKGH
jgi:hypothetical protein